MKKGSEKRILVLEYSLTLELMASFALAFLLDIKYSETSESKSLGNSSSALSFNQKVNLLLDNKSITQEERLKLEAFMNIRNQFIHNVHANSYENAIKGITGLKNRLSKFYPELFNNADLEHSIEKCIRKLFSDCLSILAEFKGGKENKLKITSEREVYSRKYKVLNEAMSLELDNLVEFVKQQETNSINKEDILPKLQLLKYQIIVKSNAMYDLAKDANEIT